MQRQDLFVYVCKDGVTPLALWTGSSSILQATAYNKNHKHSRGKMKKKNVSIYFCWLLIDWILIFFQYFCMNLLLISIKFPEITSFHGQRFIKHVLLIVIWKALTLYLAWISLIKPYLKITKQLKKKYIFY